MEEYIKESKEASEDTDIIGLYDKELHEDMMRNTDIKNATEKGITIGIEKGIKQGRIENSIDIAKNMIKDGIDKEKISFYTKLTIEEIDKLI